MARPIVSASLRAGMIATTRGHCFRGLSSTISSWTCQKFPRAKKRYSQIASGTTAIKFGFRCTRYCATSQRAELYEIFLANRQPAQALAGRSEDRIADRGRHHWQSGLADAGGILLAHYHVDLGERSLVDAWHAVVVEVRLLDAPILDGNSVVQRGGEA